MQNSLSASLQPLKAGEILDQAFQLSMTDEMLDTFDEDDKILQVVQ